MSPRKDKIFPCKINESRRSEIIETITSLYVLLFKTGENINLSEVNIFYSLLENLFHDEGISWEQHIRKLTQNKRKIEDVLSYLNKHLITLDKIRILLSVIVMANSDADFSTSEVAKILDLSKKLNVETEGFMSVIDAIEYDKKEPVYVKGFNYFAHSNKSIFKDYILLGSSDDCDVKFAGKNVAGHELLVLAITDHLFVGTSPRCQSGIGDTLLKPNRLYTFPGGEKLKIGNLEFTEKDLFKIYKNQNIRDVIDFTKSDHDFKIINNKNRYFIVISRGTVYRNDKLLPHYKEIPLYFDDKLQIKDYEAFNILEVIQRRNEIGTENIRPKELFICYENDYFTITKFETPKSIGHIVSQDDNFIINPPKRGWDFYLNNQKIETPQRFNINTDTLTINRMNFRINSFHDLVEIPFEVEKISIQDIRHLFNDGKVGLDGVSLEAYKGEMIAVLGQSGCGKSTLLKCLCSEIIPTYGTIKIDDKNFFQNLSFFTKYIGYVPQEDLIFPNLTVYENLLYRSRLSMPKISKTHLDQKITNILTQTNLLHRKNSQVGDVKNKFLSGGERKRLNIAMELLFEPTVIICDEPTSGLSSADSEHIIYMLKDLSNQGKIIILTIHQPNPEIFSKFDRILLMDRGGYQVYFGTYNEAFDYFDIEFSRITKKKKEILRKKELRMPEYMFDIISYPQYNEKGEVTYTQSDQNLVVKRKFPPVYWRDKFKRKMLFDLFHAEDEKTIRKNIPATRKKRKADIQTHWTQFKTFFIRNMMNKIRNKVNMFITFAQAPFLALLISFILRLAPNEGRYTYYNNINIGVFCFISIIVFLFLGMSNSIEDILSERRNILREKMLNLKVSYYFSAKLITLGIFSLIQVILYYTTASLLLEIKGNFIFSIIYLFLSTVTGYSIGLLISCFIDNSKAVINYLPLLMIPQIIFGGALIEFEKMNHDLKIIDKSPIPEVVQFIPSRWLFEGIFTAYAKFNAYEYSLTRLEKKRLTTADNFRNGKLNNAEYYGILNKIYREKKEIADKYPKKEYTNLLNSSAVNLMDGKFLNTDTNVFLAGYKNFFGRRYRTPFFNIFVILFYVSVIQAVTVVKLKYFYKEKQ
ncbi:MAG: hypothetical protein CSB55_04205 [Candidatus Cloacimonadota bacterium]|nr:MAG: hypothetical protein CSB55_04205 [Candidatus Cloacimonadota bacterium]